MTYANPSDDILRPLLSTARTIAMVGASSNPDRASYGIMRKLQSVGYNVIPVNPREAKFSASARISLSRTFRSLLTSSMFSAGQTSVEMQNADCLDH